MTATSMRAILTATLLAGLALAATAGAGDGTCQRDAAVCVDGPATKMISGYPVTRECWRHEERYTCRIPAIRLQLVRSAADLASGVTPLRREQAGLEGQQRQGMPR